MLHELELYADSFVKKHIDKKLFQLDGDLVCPVGSIPLEWYVDYNNYWWVHFVRNATAKTVIFNKKDKIGVVCFNLEYYSVQEFPFIQYVRFNKENKIDCVRTYWNFDWAMKLTKLNPIMEAVQIGDALWMQKDITLDEKMRLSREYWTADVVKKTLDFDKSLEHLVDTFKHLHRI